MKENSKETNNRRFIKPPTPPKYEVKVKSKKKYWYIIPLLNVFGSLIVLGLLFLFKTKILYIIIYSIIIFPVFFFSGLIAFIRVYLDRHRIVGKITKWVSKNFIVANFYRQNKRFIKIVRTIDKENATFDYKGGIYCIDLDCVWYDENNHPNSFYLEGLPNPLKFAFSNDIKDFIATQLAENPKPAINKKGELIDISFSATTLQMLKKDKIFRELQRNPESEKFVMVLIGVIVLMIIALVIIVLVVGK